MLDNTSFNLTDKYYFLRGSVALFTSVTLKMAALCPTEYITDLSEGRGEQPNQCVARPPASYFGDPGFKLRWAYPELSLSFLNPSSYVPKYYIKSCYDRFLSYSCQLFTHISYYHSLRAQLPRCSSMPGGGAGNFFLMYNIQGVCGTVSASCAVSATGCFRGRQVTLP